MRSYCALACFFALAAQLGCARTVATAPSNDDRAVERDAQPREAGAAREAGSSREVGTPRDAGDRDATAKAFDAGEGPGASEAGTARDAAVFDAGKHPRDAGTPRDGTVPDSTGDAAICRNSGDLNLDCPPLAARAECQPRGVCCHGADNAVAESSLPSDGVTELDYRLNYMMPVNQEQTLGDKLVATLGIAQIDYHEVNLLFRLQLPRAGGFDAAGKGTLTFGPGRYNCDGSYSFYDDSAGLTYAAGGLADDVARWAPIRVSADYDPAQVGTPQFLTIPWSERASRKLTFYPMLKPAPDNTYDYEIVRQGMRLLNFNVEKDGRACIGRRTGMIWTAGGQIEAYLPVGPNNKQIYSSIQETYATLTGFGITTDKTLDCEKTPRCVPGSTACSWRKLPDSLCPTNDAELDVFGCHLGDTTNANLEKNYPVSLPCLPTPPTEPQDPAKVSTTGQCCDPLAHGTNGLPACNAWRVIYDIVAAAAPITSEPKHPLQSACP